MQLSTLSNPYSSIDPSPQRGKYVREEIELRDRSESEISPWWKIFTVTSYFLVVIGGIMTSISIGTLLAAFQNNCVLYARITVRGVDEIIASGENLTLYDENIVEEHYGNLYDCTFSEYCSVASTIFGAIWGILFLQCGRGGVTKRSLSQSWTIVPPAILVDIVFFTLSCIIFGKIIGGLSFFCMHLKAETYTAQVANITSCKEIMAFRFPGDLYNTNLYLNYIIAQVGSFLTFFGWLVALFVLILRCFIPVDFVVYGRKQYTIKKITGDEKRKIFATSKTSGQYAQDFSTKAISIDVFGEENYVATTSFSVPSTSKTVVRRDFKKVS